MSRLTSGWLDCLDSFWEWQKIMAGSATELDSLIFYRYLGTPSSPPDYPTPWDENLHHEEHSFWSNLLLSWLGID